MSALLELAAEVNLLKMSKADMNSGPRSSECKETIKPDRTDCLFLKETYKFSHQANVVEVGKDEKFGVFVILDSTIFHPQGGGQPSDTGIMTGGGVQFNVKKVVYGSTNPPVVRHFGEFDTEECFNSGDPVNLEINDKDRELFAKAHSAGHLLDYALSEAGFALKPTKGCHFPSSLYVEYSGNVPADERVSTKKKMQEILDGWVKEQNPVKVKYLPRDEYESTTGECPPKDIGDEIRVIDFGVGTPYMCGGTHVDSTGRFEKIEVRSLKKKGKNFRISYSVA